jgi:mRNA interferase MazF
MVDSHYTPQRGDIVWLEFDPQAGHEQKGRRPALVISHGKYNEKVSLALFCPITSKTKNYPFEVPISKAKITGSILSDQIKSLDWKARKAEFIERITDEEMNSVIDRIQLLIE